MKGFIKFAIIAIAMVALFGCEATQRGWQDIRSSVSGLDRTATVYSSDGTVIKEYEGRFDVETNDYGNKVKFDINGRRVLIYNAIVIVEERE